MSANEWRQEKEQEAAGKRVRTLRKQRTRASHQSSDEGMRVGATASIVAFTLLAAACETAGESESRARSTRPQSTQLHIGDSESFTPATHKEHGKVIMTVTFPDGSTAEIVYPPDTDIAAMGAQPYSSGQLSDCCARDFFVLFGGVPKGELAGEAPLKIYRGADGSPVEYWRNGASGHDPKSDRWLILNFHPWYVLVWDEKGSMTDQNLASWARGLAGAQTRDGFLRLSADQPLQLAKAGEHAGPELLFSDRRQMVSFFVGDCEPDPKDDGKMVALGGKTGPAAEWFASRCFVNQSMRIHVQSEDETFARRVIDRVEIRNVHFAS